MVARLPPGHQGVAPGADGAALDVVGHVHQHVQLLLPCLPALDPAAPESVAVRVELH